MNLQAVVHVNLGVRSYPVNIGYGVLSRLGLLMRTIENDQKVLIVTEKNVGNLYLEQLLEQLRDFEVETIYLPPGEDAKSVSFVDKIWKKMYESKMGRYSNIIAFGGGSVGDTGGFAASTYMRGVNLINIPTDLLAFVDSSIGGKNGLDFEGGKNILGTFYQPRLVLSELKFIATLPEVQYKSGLAEVIKYGIIYEKGIFKKLEDEIEKVKLRDEGTLFELCVRCAAVKAKIVEIDEYDFSERHLLNFGHTIGHAIEAESGFSVTHGEAVAIGMCLESRIAVKMGLLKEKESKRIERLIESYSLPTTTKLPIDRVLKRLCEDKKFYKGLISIPVVKSIGQATIINLDERDLMRLFE